MNVTRCVLAVFSPTGGTQKIAQAVGKGTGLPVRTVDLCQNADACTIGPEELLVAVKTFLKASAGKPKQPEMFL